VPSVIDGYSVDATIQTADFGVFIDFMSMFQPDDTTGAKPAYTKPAEQASFGRALRNIGLLYGHAGSVVFKMTKTPLPAAGDPDRVYQRRGWCHLERRLGDLEAPASNSLDVAAWPTAEAERAARKKLWEKGLKTTEAQRGPPQLRESEEELAAQGDHVYNFSPGTLGALIRDGGRGAPLSPEHFEEELKEKVFSFDADRTVCAGLYRDNAEPLLAAVEELTFTNLAWTAADWRHMGGVLACCTKLKKLTLEGMGVDDAAMAAFGGALGSGAAPALKDLDLQENKIGDEGLRHLSDALARGAAPALKYLDLDSNPASDAAIRAAKPQQRWLDGAFLVRFHADAKVLDCWNLGWGDDEARRLAAALEHAHAHGALKALKKLFLSSNKIGDEGMRHLGDALARGAAPALKALDLDGNPASPAAHRAVKDALENRKCLVAQALYSFTGEDATELSFREGDILTIVPEPPPEGWLYAENSAGERGLVPATYVGTPRRRTADSDS
jgi:hypothetical protein